MTPKLPTILLVVFASLLLAAPATAAPAAPLLLSPFDGDVTESIPAFEWTSVAGADKYEFEITADPGFNSPLLTSDYSHFFTKNVRAHVKRAIPNGVYYWRVRAIDVNGNPSPWSASFSLLKDWASAPNLTAPADGGTFVYPADAFKLSWNPVAGAANYEVEVATDPLLGSLVWDGKAIKTQATDFTALHALAAGTYYWAITPLDSQGNPGAQSEVRSFTVEWPSETTGYVEDLVAADELYDPQLSWDAVPGARGYEVEINFSSDWAGSSKVCCGINTFTKVTTIATTLSPPVVLPNNHYYWRVRAVDPSGNAGQWNDGPQFTKTFDNVPPVVVPSVKNLRMRDNTGDPGADVDAGAGYQTQVPVVTWDPVPGASSYLVEVAPAGGATGCAFGTASPERWLKETATNAWTPLGNNPAADPWPNPLNPSSDSLSALVVGHSYCVRVRAIDKASSTSGAPVFGDWTYLPGGADDTGVPAFEFVGYPPGEACAPSCNTGYLGSADYLEPTTGVTVGRMPLFTWKALAGAQSYFVVVARDANFTNVVDYAFTPIPAYAPRTGTQTRGYADETTLYYWAVLPAPNANGAGTTTNPLQAAFRNFTKQSTPPTLVSPAPSASLSAPVTFRWTTVEAARRYVVQVSQDPNFSTLLERTTGCSSGTTQLGICTDSTAYTTSVSYPADTVLYWRVRAEAENDASSTQRFVGLTWSQTGTFQKTFPALTPNNVPAVGAAIPTWTWSRAQGAVSYEIHVDLPNGTKASIDGIPSASFTPTLMKGTGIWRWRARANYPQAASTVLTKGPWTTLQSFARTIPEPSNPATEVGTRRLLFSWDPRPGTQEYKVQVSTKPDFSTIVETATTDNPLFASRLTASQYAAGGTFYWRVAAADDVGRNVGDFTAAQPFTLPASASATLARFRLSAVGYPVRNRWRTVKVYVRNATNRPVAGAAVRVSGAGLVVRTRKSGSTGVASFRIRPTKLGTVTFKVSKVGFNTAYLYRKVRLP